MLCYACVLSERLLPQVNFVPQGDTWPTPLSEPLSLWLTAVAVAKAVVVGKGNDVEFVRDKEVRKVHTYILYETA